MKNAFISPRELLGTLIWPPHRLPYVTFPACSAAAATLCYYLHAVYCVAMVQVPKASLAEEQARLLVRDDSVAEL